MITKETKVIFSVAAQPGNFGAIAHNAGYRALGLDYVYLPRALSPRTRPFEEALEGCKVMGIHGLSVSMPFKARAYRSSDLHDRTAKVSKAANTIIFESEVSKAYNTDIEGARIALETLGYTPGKSALILGAGGAARAVLQALYEMQSNPSGLPPHVGICCRHEDRARQWFNGHIIPWESRHEIKADLLINATPLGMNGELPLDFLRGYEMIFEVIARRTPLFEAAASLGIPAVNGFLMALHQAAAQFKLYTGKAAPLEAMEAALILNLEDYAKGATCSLNTSASSLISIK